MPSACVSRWQTFPGYNFLIIFNKPVCDRDPVPCKYLPVFT